jgi:pyruvate ferredoxin oxidoreductase gamma subunit
MHPENYKKLPKVNVSGFFEIRMESIGGFGANLAGKILGEAGVLAMGYNGSNFSSYGSEKKGSPVKSFVRLCAPDKNVRVNSPVTEPHILVIFHEEMIRIVPVTQGVGKDSVVVFSTGKSPDEARAYLKLHGGTIHCVDAMKIAVEENTRVNTALLGAICKVSGFIDPEAVKDMIKKNLGKKYAFLIEPNLKTFDRGYKEGVSKYFEPDGKYPYVPFSREGQKLGYFNQNIGGVITTPGNSVTKDLSSTRSGWIPVLDRSVCTSCGECDITCPDYVMVWDTETDQKGKEKRVLQKYNYQYCKGCLRCVEICKFDALKAEKEYEVDKKIIEAGFTRSKESA